MLFPTIERMAQTPQGKVMTPVLCHMRYVAYLPLFLLSLLPEGLKASLIKRVFSCIRSLDHTVVQPTVGLLSGDCAGWLCFVLYSCDAYDVHLMRMCYSGIVSTLLSLGECNLTVPVMSVFNLYIFSPN